MAMRTSACLLVLALGLLACGGEAPIAGGGDGGSDAATNDAATGAVCSNGLTESPAETCDDGNLVTEACAYGETTCDICDSSCELVAGEASYCGDAFVDTAHESCESIADCDFGTCMSCRCAMAGTVELPFGAMGVGFDASEDTTGLSNHGDFYFIGATDPPRFWANNLGMQGLVDLGVVEGDLLDVPIPSAGYEIYGIDAVLDHVYVSPANSEDHPDDHFVVFRVTTLDGMVATLDYRHIAR
jgi:hypothetical protein